MEPQFTPFAEYIKTRAGSDAPPSPKDGFQIQCYNAGETIFSQGAKGHAAYLIKKGTVEISIQEDGGKTVLTCLSEQSVFGEVALLTGNHTRSATATAMDATEVIRIPKEIFDKYLKASPKVISACLVAIARRLDDFSASSQARPAILERIARVIALGQSHGAKLLDYDRTVNTLTRVLDKKEQEIKDHLSTMADVNLVDLDCEWEGRRAIALLGGEKFLEKALKVFALIEGSESA